MPAKRKASQRSRTSAKRTRSKSVSTNARMSAVRLPRKLTTAKTHPEGDLSKHLGLMKRPFMQGIAQPKLPDGEVSMSLGERLRTTGQIICKSVSYILLFPGLGHCISLGNASTNYVASGSPTPFGELPYDERKTIMINEAYDGYVSSFGELKLTDGELRTMFEFLVNSQLYTIDENSLYQKYVESFPAVSITLSDMEKAFEVRKANGELSTLTFTEWIENQGGNLANSYPSANQVKQWLGDDDYFINLGREPKAFNDWAVDQDFMKLGFEVYEEDVADRRRERVFPNDNENEYLKGKLKVPKSLEEFTLEIEIPGGPVEIEPKAVTQESNIFHSNHDFGWRVFSNWGGADEGDQYYFGHFDGDHSSGWRVVSQGCRLELLNNDHENDGWFEACRFKSRISPTDVALFRDDGGSGTVLTTVDAPIKLLPGPDTQFWTNLDNISFNRQTGYLSGKLSEIGKHEFSLMRDKTDRSLINREVLDKMKGNASRSSDDAFFTPNTTTGRLRLNGTTHGSKVLDQLVDRNLDCVLIKVYGRSDTTSPTRLMFDCIQNVEFTVDAASEISKYQTPNVAHPDVDAVMDTENNNESASRRK